MGQIHTDIPGAGPVLLPRSAMGFSVWCVRLSTSGPVPNSEDNCSELIPITVEEIISRLSTGAYLGEAENAAVHLCRAGDS